MKNLFFITLVTIASLVMVSCDSTTDPVTPTPDPKGSLFVTSVPAGAQIWRDGVNTNKVTPDTLKDLDPKVYSITLKLQGYIDTTFSVSVSANQTSVVTNVPMVSNVILTNFGPVRIWETLAPSTSQPSGLDLSTGLAVAVSGTDKMNVDLYYTSTSFLVQSANLNTTQGLTRITKFQAGNSNNLNDGVSSPLQNVGTWISSMADRDTTKYIFLFDNDAHYSKIKVTNYGGGTNSNDPAWVELTWKYNGTANDTRF